MINRKAMICVMNAIRHITLRDIHFFSTHLPKMYETTIDTKIICYRMSWIRRRWQ